MEYQDNLSLTTKVKMGKNIWSTIAFLSIPAFLLTAATLFFVNDFLLEEPDLTRMMAALIYGNKSADANIADIRPYGIYFSYGWYDLIQMIAPNDWLHSPDLTSRLINRFGIASGLICAFTCTLYLNALYGRTVAIAASTMFFLCPMMLPVAFSGHPIIAAGACLFTGGWLLTFTEKNESTTLTWGCFLGALVILTLGLSLRAEIVVAFPFIWLATKKGSVDKALWLTLFGLRGLLLAAAFGIFLLAQSHYTPPTGGAGSVLSDFIKQFSSISKISKGLVIIFLSFGGATFVIALTAVIKGARCKRWDLYLLIILTLPSLALFLPNPQPARHFFFPALAIFILLALLLERWQGKCGRVLAISLLVALMNQVLIEMVHPVIVARANYVLNYPSLTDRRFTPAAPSGAFMLDQQAMQINDEAEREEAILLAAQMPDRLIVLADHYYLLIAHILAKDPTLKCDFGEENGIPFTKLQSKSRTILFIAKFPEWPRDITQEVLHQQTWQDWPVYVQPSTKSPYDKTEIPPNRVFNFVMVN